ncbi:MAG TPA: hypothetical protein VNM48_09410 [Chloroflexota bacterium]|nr:hypothetical protein [Chloroflexota bacterium]
MKLELRQSSWEGPHLAAPEAPTRPAEAPTEAPAPSSPRPDEGGREKEGDSEPDIDEQIKRIIREMPDPTPQPGGE